MQLSNQPITWQ